MRNNIQLLKAELHIHAKEDKTHRLDYSAKELIDLASSMNYEVLAFTFHNNVFEGEAFRKAERYAKKKGIILIPGCEATIEGKHTLLYNITESERKKIKTFSQLRKWKAKAESEGRNVMVIAPHPYYRSPYFGKYCLANKLVKNIDIFDAIEHSFLYTRVLNLNRKAKRVAKKYHKPVVGNSDVHLLENLGKTYTLIKSRKTVNDVISAIKAHQVELVTKPLTVKHLAKLALFHSIKRK